jgi:dynactin complex subunit
MTDLTERLRAAAETCEENADAASDDQVPGEPALYTEAADAIERLRVESAVAQNLAQENERLRAAQLKAANMQDERDAAIKVMNDAVAKGIDLEKQIERLRTALEHIVQWEPPASPAAGVAREALK